MKALVTTDPKTVSVQDVPIPTPEQGEILVKVTYAAQNPTDWKSAAAAKPGRICGCDFAGTVEDANGSRWEKGQRVAGWVHGGGTDPVRGAFAQYLVTEATVVYAIPDGISDASAATVPLAFSTAVQALFQRLELPTPSQPAEKPFAVLIYGGTSSVGVYAIQLAKLAGLRVVTTGSERNHDFLRGLGADETLDYNDINWPEQARHLTQDGLEYALDCISENGSPKAIAKAMSPLTNSRVMALLPVGDLRESEEFDNQRVKLESTLAYSVFGRPLFGRDAFDNVGGETPQDKAFWEKYLALLPELLTSGKIKPNRVREMGGLEAIPTGFEEQREGKVSAEKLVYAIGTS